MTLLSEKQWDEFIERYPDAHLLQTSRWGRFKGVYDWRPFYLGTQDSGAQILFRKLILNLSIAYIPKGPVGEDWQELIAEAVALCKEQNAIVLYIEPDFWEGEQKKLVSMLPDFSMIEMAIQPRRTITISLDGSEDDWLGRMKQKTRYNIRLAKKKEVIVSKSSDIDVFNILMQETGQRDEFGIHQASYYRSVYELFHPLDACELFVASYEDEPLAAIMVFKRGSRAWYFYGASNNRERNRMPTYLLQWEAMRWAASSRCNQYDLWGVPDAEQEELEKQFTSRSDGLWGVYRFKRGFGGELKRSAGVYAKILRPGLYRLYQTAMKIRKNSLS